MDKDITEALTKAGLQEQFLKLPPSHQREYNQWIDAAKKPETRAKRISKMVEMLSR